MFFKQKILYEFLLTVLVLIKHRVHFLTHFPDSVSINTHYFPLISEPSIL